MACPSAQAQDHSTPYIPLGSRLDQLTRWAVAQGALPQLDPQVRPFRMVAVEQAVAAADTLSMTANAHRAIVWLREALDLGRDSSALVAELGVESYGNGRRDSFRPGGRSGSALALGLRGALHRGAFSVVMNPLMDTRLKDDPEFTGYADRAIAGRLAEAYLAVSGAPGELVVGRLAHAWGPEGFDGLLVSDVAYPVEAIGGTLRLDRFELRSLVQRLDDYDTTLTATVTRWRAAHRLGIALGRGWHLGLTETVVYGGPGRGFDPALSLPVAFALLAQYNEDREANAQLGVDLSAPLARGLQLQLAGFLDDIQVDDSALTDRRPSSYGVTSLIQWALPAQPVVLSVGYTRVTNLAYRNSMAPWYQYALAGVGLGRNFSDYDQVLLRAQWRPSPRWSALVELSYLRQGAGDFRRPFPDDSTLAQAGQGFLVSPVRTAPGFRARVTGEIGPGIDASAELGATRRIGGGTEGIGSIKLRMRWDALAGRLGGTSAALDADR